MKSLWQRLLAPRLPRAPASSSLRPPARWKEAQGKLLAAVLAQAETAFRSPPRPDAPARLARPAADAPARHAEPPAPSPGRGAAPGSFTAGRYAEAGAERSYKLYVPTAAAAGLPMPLVLMLHGCTQDPDDFAVGTGMNLAAEAHGVCVLYPAQMRHANAQKCWNWFKPQHQQRGRGEPAWLAGLVRHVGLQHDIDSDRVYAAGLSAGGAMAAILGTQYGDVFAAVGIHSGLVAGAAADLPSAFAAMKGQPRVPGSGGPARAPGRGSSVPAIVFQGDADATVHPANAAPLVAASTGSAGRLVDTQAQPRAPGGRASTRHVHADAAGHVLAEHWVIHGAAHAWSGGQAGGSYTDPAGPDASREMLRFFFEHPRRPGA